MTPSDGRLIVAVLPRIEGEPYLRSVFTDNDQYVGVSATKDLLRTGSFDILHVQWPESFFTGDLRRRLTSTGRLLRAMTTARRHSKPVVVTIHNLKPHDSKLTMSNRRLVRFQLESAEAVIVLTNGGVDRARHAFIKKKSHRVEVIPHPNWASEYAPPPNWTTIRQATRRRLGLSEDILLFSMLGSVRAYKGVAEVVQRWREFYIGDSQLLIAGKFATSEYERLPLLDRDSGVLIQNRRLDENEYRALLLATDVAIFNFTDIENSGSFVAALAAGCRTLAPDVGALREFSSSSYPAAELRCTWFDERISTSLLAEQVRLGTADRPARANLPVAISAQSSSIILQHSELYRTLLA